MDYKRARKQLKKIKTLLDSFESLEEPISPMEADLLRKYADVFKEIIPHGETTLAPVVELPKKKEKSKTKVAKEEKVFKSEVDKVKGEEKVEQIVEEFDVPPVLEELVETNGESKTDPVIVTPLPSQEVEIPEVKIPRKSRKKLVAEVDEEELANINLWEPAPIKDLSEKLSFSPIKDIHKSISINERIFTQNELFGGDHLLFRSTLEKLESMSSFKEAADYLRQGVAKDQNWESSDKLKKAIQFMHLVQRRYL